MCPAHFCDQGHVTITVHFLTTKLKPTMKCYTLKNRLASYFIHFVNIIAIKHIDGDPGAIKNLE